MLSQKQPRVKGSCNELGVKLESQPKLMHVFCVNIPLKCLEFYMTNKIQKLLEINPNVGSQFVVVS